MGPQCYCASPGPTRLEIVKRTIRTMGGNFGVVLRIILTRTDVRFLNGQMNLEVNQIVTRMCATYFNVFQT